MTLTRRQLFTILPAGAGGCLGCFGRCAAQTAAPARALGSEKSGMTWEEVFKFAYARSIPIQLKLAEQIGRKQYVEMVRKATTTLAAEAIAKIQVPAAERTLAKWVAGIKQDPMYPHVLVYDTVKDEPGMFEIRVSQCLWAKSFRAADAGDIGYASICHPDFAAASSWNPKMKLGCTKTLMQGDDHCNPRWSMESV